MITTIEAKAHKILEQSPEVVVRYRLLRDVLKRPTGDVELSQAKEEMYYSPNVQELANEQWADGSWGAFHTRNTCLNQKIITTEAGVERALALGLDAAHPILEKTTNYLLRVMNGEIPFPDRHEKNDRWQTGLRLILASTLALIHPIHPVLDQDRKLWVSIAELTFQSGKYSEEDEIEAHSKLTGASVKDSYLVLNHKYQLNILGSIPGLLPKELEAGFLRWLWNKEDGIGYLGIPLNREPPDRSDQIDRWLASLELVARAYPLWINYAQPSIEWLWSQQNERGYWDFGTRPASITRLPLSENWRKKGKRENDWTTRVLALLRVFWTGFNKRDNLKTGTSG
ncbi:MAG: hypothetical protein ACNA8H_04370 [Anaerolineales bacterium]